MTIKNITQYQIDKNFFDFKALSDYLNIHYYIEYDDNGKAKITVKERVNHD